MKRRFGELLFLEAGSLHLLAGGPKHWVLRSPRKNRSFYLPLRQKPNRHSVYRLPGTLLTDVETTDAWRWRLTSYISNFKHFNSFTGSFILLFCRTANTDGWNASSTVQIIQGEARASSQLRQQLNWTLPTSYLILLTVWNVRCLHSTLTHYLSLS